MHSNLTIILAVIVAVMVGGGAVLFFGTAGIPQQITGGGIITPSQPTTTQAIKLSNCPVNTLTATLNYQYTNPLNSSNPDFLPAAVRGFVGGSQVFSGTA